MQGKTVLITGGNAGIGKATAIGLAKKGARIILACRNKQKGAKAVEEIINKTGHEKVGLTQCDLASFASIRNAVKEVKAKHEKVDVLINNAGIFMSASQKTQDGFEMQFGVNHLGHFLLTTLLLPMLKEASKPRIVNVSSVAHFHGEIDFENLKGENQNYKGLKAYAQSKLANVLFTRELARRYPKILSNCLHPGVVRTNFGCKNSRWYLSLFWHCWRPLMFSPKRGACTSIHLAASPKVEGISGQYFNERRRICKVAPLAKDDLLANKLWEASSLFVGLKNSPLRIER